MVMKKSQQQSDSLIARKQALFEARLKERGLKGERQSTISLRQKGDSIPLSFAQQRLWFLHQLEPDSSVYNIPQMMQLQGELDVHLLEKSLTTVIGRHESLRTTFPMQDNQPVQQIAPDPTIQFPLVDLTRLQALDHEAEALKIAQQEFQQPFDLAAGPLLRVMVVRSTQREHYLFITMHHIISDAWSGDLLIQELVQLYVAYREERPAQLPALPVQYADFAIWQREWLQGPLLDQQLQYWRRKLHNVQPLDLPFDHPRSSMPTFEGRQHHITLSIALQDRLKALAQREDVTLFMLLLAAFQMLLAYYSGQTDISVGTPISQRKQAELESLIGFFVNTVVIRSDLADNPTFLALLKQVREVALEAYTHQDVPFEKMVEAIHPERGLSNSPLFQCMFVLQHAQAIPELDTGIQMHPLPLESTTAKFDLVLIVTESAQGLRCTFEYSTSLFEASTIQRMFGHWQNLLETILHTPYIRLQELNLLTTGELQQQLVSWNATQSEYPVANGLHHLFEAQARRIPDAAALTFEDSILTYAALDQQANRLAHILRAYGVGPDQAVGICLERTLAMPMALLAILKAGGAYLPLDPTYPQERLQIMLADAQPPVVITQQSLREHCPQHPHCQLLVLEEIYTQQTRFPTTPPEVAFNPEQLLYIIYTSGSTGIPKGISMPHRPLVNLMHWQQAHSFAHQGSRTLQFTTLSFDAACQEIFATWSTGGILTITSHEVRINPQVLLQTLREAAIERLFVPFVALQQLAQVAQSERQLPDHLQEVITAGEQLQVSGAVELFFSALADCTLINQYGPAECHVVTSFTLDHDVSSWSALPSIGTPVSNTQMYILNPALQPVPVGVAGEVYIGGKHVARGYLARPGQSAERFIPDPFSREPGARLYKTGDLARYQSTGLIDFIGRADTQVKIRGYRIELFEIEEALRSHPSIHEAIVSVLEVDPSDKRLVAYVLPAAAEQMPAAQELRQYLQERLPDYMVPAFFSQLDALPLTPSGKIDRRSLPELNIAQLLEEQEDAGTPRTPIEELIATVWCEVLGRQTIGIHENFFAIGGHSLLATQVMSRLQRLVRPALPLRLFFETATIEKLARAIEQLMREEQENERPSLSPAARRPQIPLSFAQQRLWFIEQLEPGSVHYHLPTALLLEGMLEIAMLERALRTVISRHESLRTVFHASAGHAFQFIQAADPTLIIPVIDLSKLGDEASGNIAHGLAKEEARQPFDLVQGPLMRVKLLRLSIDRHVLLLTIHHIVADGWSMQILIHEISQLYNALNKDEPSPLTELPIQYADFAIWQQSWLQGDLLTRELHYWRQNLAGVSTLNLPTDYARPALQTFHGARLYAYLTSDLTSSLKKLSQREGVTLFMLLLAAFQVLLARYSGQDDIAVGTPIAGRTHTELEQLIGFFVNTLVMRSDLAGASDFRQLLARVRETTLQAYAHQDVPFEKLVEALQPERDLSRSPLFQAMFALHNIPAANATIDGLEVSYFKQEATIARYDLTLEIMDTPPGLVCAFEYNSDLFAAETIAGMLEHWQILLEGIVARPSSPLSALPLLTPRELQLLLHTWNDSAVPSSSQLSLPQAFSLQAAHYPDRVALSFQDQLLTFSELDHRADLLASFLQRHGIGPEHCIPLCLQRSPDLLLALLAVLKTGAAYLPLDPSYPAQRLRTILDEVRPLLLLTQQDLLPLVGDHASLPLCLDQLWPRLLDPQADLLPLTSTVAFHPDQLAYVIYTSGSTGRPKGVMVTQHNLLNFLAAMLPRLQLQEQDRWLAITSISFDIAALEIFLPLLCGTQISLAPRHFSSDGAALARHLDEEAITIMQATPTTWQLLLTAGWRPHADLQVLCGGEAFPPALASQLHPARTLWNLYGPTETTIWSAAARLAALERTSPVPLGAPLDNTTLYVLDRVGQLVPPGVPGELFIGGQGVARGYFRQAGLTAERFLPDPFSATPGERLYRTGDVVRYRANGRLEYLGRGDQQIKLRGLRIEIGEIEAALVQHPTVREAVVSLWRVSEADQRLVAYVIAQPNSTIATQQLRDHLRQMLPNYMVPAYILVMEQFPLTPNGKIDRLGLPTPEEQQSEVLSGRARPLSPIEEVIAGFYHELLALKQPEPQSHFFAAGGHSLLATQLQARIRAIAGVEVPLRAIFERPTIEGIARAIQDKLREQPTPSQPSLCEVARTQPLPLSFAQQRLWFLDQLEPASTAYTMPATLRLSGPLHARAFEHSIKQIVQRHEILRTTFQTRDTIPVQVIGDADDYHLPIVDLRGLLEETREAEIHRLAIQETETGFDLSTGPLLRTTLLRAGVDEHIFLLTTHHIIADAWSTNIFMRELSYYYHVDLTQQPTTLPELPIQYADYAAWQHNWFGSEQLQTQLGYWKEQLRNIEPLNLPTDHSRPAIQTFHGSHQHITIAPPLLQALQTLSQQENATLFMTLVTAFQILLARYSGQSDISVGTDIANRTQLELEGLIGFFANTLVLRTNLTDNPTFTQALVRVRHNALQAYANQDIPFERIVEELQPERDLSRPPLFQVLVSSQPATLPTEETTTLEGVRIQTIPLLHHSAKFDLTFSWEETATGLHCDLEYNTDLFEFASIARLLEHWRTLLEQVVSQPESRIQSLPLLSERERNSMLNEWNSTQADYPLQAPFHRLFEQQASQTPDRIAVVYQQEYVTYAELNRRAQQLARQLLQRGIQPEQLVGLYLERSVEMLIGMLAIFKAGAAYVPLDPAYPQQRIATIVEDAEPAIILTTSTLRPTMPGTINAICLDENDRDESDDPPISQQQSAHQLAYTIYTSGSTGRPKGAMVTHQGMLNHLFAKIKDLRLTENDFIAQTASHCFDISVWQFCASLMLGGQVDIIPNQVMLEPQHLLQEIRARQISILEVVPSFLSLLLDEVEQLEEDRLAGKSLRWLIVTGEAVSPALTRRWLQRYPDIPLLNAYGPTECSDDVTHARITEPPAAQEVRVPLGYPIVNTRIYILDSRFAPVPISVSGRIYVGGKGVGRGYLRRPEQTAAVFLPDPFGQEAGARLYDTGDLGRYRADGSIEFLGRVDEQVKVRGYRIELGEIEAVLQQHPAVHSARVIDREVRAGDKRLVAYIIAEEDMNGSLDIAELKRHLRNRLPEYMVPLHFVALSSLPLLPNGKVDRSALPSPEENATDAEQVQRGLTPIEEMVSGIYAQVLGLESVGGDDNFFALGGYSLLATQIISRIRPAIQREIPLSALFEHPGVSDLAGYIERSLQQTARKDMPALVAVSREEPLPLSFAQKRLWFLDQLEPDSTAYILAHAVQLRGPLNVEALQWSLNELVRRHESLRTSIQGTPEEPLQHIQPASGCPLPVCDLSGLPQEERQETIETLLRAEIQQKFVLSAGPLLRVRLLRIGRETHILLISMHHIISDGWSMSIFVSEFTSIYNSYVHGEAHALPALPLQYADFATWQQKWLRDGTLDEQLAYWLKQLEAMEPLDFPTDHPRPLVQTFRGAHLEQLLEPALRQQLQQLSQREGVTLFMTLIAAFQVLLARYSGQEDITIGTPIANRTQTQVEGIIGFFVNNLVLRTSLAGNPTFRQLLQRTREVALGAYTHQDVPFEKLVDALQLRRDLSRSPIFQVMFALQDMPTRADSLDGLEAETISFESAISKFDFTLFVTNTDQGLHCALEYNIDLFELETMRRLLKQWHYLLEGICHSAEQHINDLSLLTPAERLLLLETWPAATRKPQIEQGVQALVAAVVAQYPERIALVAHDEQITYRELDRRASQVAWRLQNLGVGPDSIVAVCSNRSLEMVIGLLGIIKANGAYLPLDPEYPPERKIFMLEDAQRPVLLADQQERKLLQAHSRATLLLDHSWTEFSTQPTTTVPIQTTIRNLAYVIYTSGSTGRPKGVAIEHRGLANLIAWHRQAFAIREEDRATHLAGSGFDAAVWELWPYLASGSCICLVDDETRPSPAQLQHYLQQQNITISFIPTPLLEHMLNEVWPTHMSLRTILTGGDRLRSYPTPDMPFKLINNYGPTENSVVTTSGSVAAIGTSERVPDLGRAITNCTTYVLDQHLRPVPLGAIGELYIGGASVARGYSGQPALTAERFLPDPFSTESGSRLYRSGDLVRYRADGRLDFIGRGDFQIKIRGFRIEMGEVEAVLARNPEIRACVVVLHEKEQRKYLVAYVVPATPTLDIAGVRAHLQQYLPAYMIPTLIMPIEAIPVTTGGKIDRKALPEPMWEIVDQLEADETPVTDVGKTLRSIWSDILHVKEVGLHDNFFHLGGDSILSIQIIARARQQGLQLTLKQLFQYQTIAELSQVVESAPVASVDEGPAHGPVELTPIQHWFFAHHFEHPAHWNQERLLEIPSDITAELLEQAWGRLLEHHDALRASYTHSEQGWRQHIPEGSQDIHSSFAHIQLAALTPAERELAITEQATLAQASLDLERGPLLRILFFDYQQMQHDNHLLIIIHHLVIDGVSWRILLEDLQTICQQIQSGQAIQLPAKSSSLKAWAERLVSYAQAPQLLAECAYWLQHRQPILPLPTDFAVAVAANDYASLRTVTAALTAQETRTLLEDVPPVYHTHIQEILLTALAQTLRHWTGRYRHLIETEGHGREELFSDIDISRTVGWFTSLFPVTLDLTGTTGNKDAITAIKEGYRSIPQHGIGYGILRYLSQDENTRQLQQQPQAELLFNYLGQFGTRNAEAEQPSTMTSLATGALNHPQERRTHLLEINAQINDDTFTIAWEYSANTYQKTTIEELANTYIEALRALITHCQSPEAGGYTPSDFQEVQLTSEQLEQIFEEIDLGE
ncbi:hypothetical protein KDA_39970 [Dictyobacter alpinus]|uniref:Carrier domain-containing protein n=1 Tax=Dictyobacter alpinus TaxID=2014873 RepID=A0A402BAT4_9CHLR|nr:hypothetical protein KDA_39970 [Dictyobacter alpinus]